MDSILEDILFGGSEDDASSASPLSGQSVSINRLDILYVFRGGEFRYKFGQCLCFYRHPWTIFYVELAELDCPLHHSSCCFRLVHCFFYRLICHHDDGIGLKIWTKFSRSHNQGEGDLLYMRVSCLGTLEGLANVIHRKLQTTIFSNQCRTDIRDRDGEVQE